MLWLAINNNIVPSANPTDEVIQRNTDRTLFSDFVYNTIIYRDGSICTPFPHGLQRSASMVHLLWTDGSKENLKTKPAGMD